MFIGLLFFLLGCVSQGVRYELELNKIAEVMGCSAVNESYTEYEFEGNKTVLTTYAVTPNLCYKLKEIDSHVDGSNITINISLKESVLGFCGDCNGSLSVVYEINKPPYNETRVRINILLKKDLLDTHELLISRVK